MAYMQNDEKMNSSMIDEKPTRILGKLKVDLNMSAADVKPNKKARLQIAKQVFL
jgi:hypothetical protein